MNRIKTGLKRAVASTAIVAASTIGVGVGTVAVAAPASAAVGPCGATPWDYDPWCG